MEIKGRKGKEITHKELKNKFIEYIKRYYFGSHNNASILFNHIEKIYDVVIPEILFRYHNKNELKANENNQYYIFFKRNHEKYELQTDDLFYFKEDLATIIGNFISEVINVYYDVLNMSDKNYNELSCRYQTLFDLCKCEYYSIGRTITKKNEGYLVTTKKLFDINGNRIHIKKPQKFMDWSSHYTISPSITGRTLNI